MAVATPRTPDPSTPSSAYKEMQPDLDMIEDVLAGARAIREGDRSAIYLPKYSAEGVDEYARRRMSAPWRPEFADVLHTLASKPFAKEVAIQGETSERIRTFTEDVDTLGNNLHVFAGEAFRRGVASGLHGILVDFPVMNPGATLADERAAGARPYWVHVPAKNLIALYTETIGGRTIVTHARIREFLTKRDGWGEITVERVRVFEPGRWETWERGERGDMVKVEEGTVSLDEVPLALFYTGKREGEVVRPPLVDLADMQIELYRAMSRQDEVLTFAGSPMLTANGMTPPQPVVDTDGRYDLPAMSIEVGPKRVLYAPPTLGGTGPAPSWDFIQPDAANIREIAAHVKSIIEDMRRLGMQPLLPRTGSTVVADASEVAKAHSAVQAWANKLKDTLEQALVYTAQWLKEETSAEVFVHTDFGIDLDGSTDMGDLLKARVAGEISRETYWDEMRRRGKLGPQFDPEEEKKRLAAEAAAIVDDAAAGDEDEDDEDVAAEAA